MSKFSSLILYLVVYTISAAFLALAIRAPKKGARFLFAIIAIVVPCVLAGIRYDVGVDYFNYYRMYMNHSNLSFFEYLKYQHASEFSFFLISKFAALFDSPQLFYGIYAFFIYAPVAKFIMERNENAVTSFLLAFFFLISSFCTGLNIMRQIAAASVAFYSIKYVLLKKPIKFLLGVGLASCFHVSAIIILPLYFIWRNKERFTIYQFRAWIIIVAYVVVAMNMPFFLQLLGERFEGYGMAQTQGRNLSILLNFIWMIIFVFFHKYITKNNPDDGLLLFMIIIGTILSFTGIFNVYIKRIAVYFNYCDFVLLLQLKHVFNKKSRPIFFLLATVYSVFMFILTYYVLGQVGIFPYNWRI